jgi:hypothetical protein
VLRYRPGSSHRGAFATTQAQTLRICLQSGAEKAAEGRSLLNLITMPRCETRLEGNPLGLGIMLEIVQALNLPLWNLSAAAGLSKMDSLNLPLWNLSAAVA